MTRWNESDARKLRTYMAEHPEFIRELESRRPKITGDTVEASAMSGKLAQGYQEALDNIRELMRDRQQESESFDPIHQ